MDPIEKGDFPACYVSLLEGNSFFFFSTTKSHEFLKVIFAWLRADERVILHAARALVYAYTYICMRIVYMNMLLQEKKLRYTCGCTHTQACVLVSNKNVE